MRKLKINILLLGGVALGVFAVLANRDTQGLSKACQNSEACMAAVAAEQEANAKAAEATEEASAFQAKVNELSAEIAAKQSEIAQTAAEVEALTGQIAEQEDKLQDEQEALAELLVNMHFEEDVEPIKVLAGASSISDLAEKQARSEVVKQQISATAEKVRRVKEKLEDDKVHVELLLVQQQQAQQQLVATRSEQAALVEKYQNDAEAYAEAAEAARIAQQEAEIAEQEAHPELYRRGSAYTGVNTYPWQEKCPSEWDEYITYWDDDFGAYKIGGYVCECVSYASWKVYEAYGIAPAWGNAYSWDDMAVARGYTVDHEPAAGTVGQVDGYPYGHVFWVESVNADGSINVTEYNNSYATLLYSGSEHYGDFGSRRISADEVWRYNFIHFE